MGRKKKVVVEAPRAYVPRDEPVQITVLEEILKYMGMESWKLRALFQDLGIATAREAYNYLRSQGRIPQADMTPEKFEPIFQELMNGSPSE